MTGGRVPVAYLVTLAAMVFTARSYARMAAAYPVAGSAYTYAQKSFGAPIGFLAGWSLLLDYLFLPMLNYLVIGIYMGAALPVGADVGVDPRRDRGGDDPQHPRHRVGVVGQRRHHRSAVRVHRRVRGDVDLLDLRIRQREPDGAAGRATAPSTASPRSSPARPFCVCPSSDSTRYPPCPRRRRTPNALCPRRS